MRIEVRELTKRFGRNEVVSRISLAIGEGELFTLLGPSGCGKTTLLRLIAGFYAADEGDILFDGRRVNDVPPHERGIGMVFQNYALWPHMTVSENIGYGLKLQKIAPATVAERVAGVLGKVSLGQLGDRYPGQLSGGQQQRVALARALVLNPRILLLDEPLSNLDAKIRVAVRAEIRKLQKDLGITTVYVTHDQEEALTLSDRIAVFNQGRVLQIGPPRALYETPESRFVADFIGINNLIDGTVETVDAARRTLTARTASGPIEAGWNGHLIVGDPCVLCVRPENAVLNAPAGAENRLEGRVVFAAYMGNTLRYDVELARGQVIKADIRDLRRHEEIALGTSVSVAFPAAGAIAIPGER